MSVDKSVWKDEVKSQKEFFESIGERVPKEIYDELNRLEERLS